MAFIDPLSQHILQRVEEMGGKKAGEDQCGSYGFVYTVKVDGVFRVAKKPHYEFLTNVSIPEKDRVLASFRKECGLLSKLRHPNIVQFIGVYYGKNSRNDIALVMEKLEYDLAQFVSKKPDIQLHVKLSILRDVTYGLVYLHEYNPPIIHRDLTARNILLTRSYQAKIADVGVSKLMDEAAKKALSHTIAPGQIYYMPPEACTARPLYTLKLDIFSFGHLGLHALLGDYPKVHEVQVTAAMLQEGTIQKMKRLVSLDLIGSDHCLYPLITQCLMDNPDKRPTTREVNTSLYSLVESYSKDVEVKEREIAQLLSKNEELTESLLERDQQIKKLQDEATAIKKTNENLKSDILDLKKMQHTEKNNKSLVQHAEMKQNYIPYTQVEHLDIPVEEEDWYYGNISENAVEVKCMTSGDYIIRYSKQHSNYVITYNWKGKRQHLIFNNTQDIDGCNTYTFGTHKFHSIKALLGHLRKSGTVISNKTGAVIIKPVLKHDKWSLSGDKVKMGKKISEGEFCDVFEALMNDKKVAVKVNMLTDPANIETFMTQLDILKECDHPNVIRLLGVCSDEDPVFIVTEYMSGGSLQDYLLMGNSSQQIRMMLCRICVDISKGMAYLESKNFIHRNLAAFNCLVGDNNIKISGFRLSTVATEGIYIASAGERYPIRWTAPEVIMHRKFSFASDVWSFGVLLWEIYSFGSRPYPGMNNVETVSQVERGYRMSQPADCPDEIYSIMNQCWQHDPKDRPNFNIIVNMLTEVEKKGQN